MVIGIEASHAAKPNRTGVEEYCFQIIQHLKKIIPADVGVVLYTSVIHVKTGIQTTSTLDSRLRGNDNLFDNLPPNWKVKVLRWPLSKLWSQVRLSWEFLFHPPDVFFAPGQLIPIVTPKKTVVMIHDSAFLVFPQAYHFLGRQYLRLMNWWILRRAQKVFTSTVFNVTELQRLYPWFDATKVAVIPLAYDADRFTVAAGLSPSLCERYGITNPYLISVGRLEEKKNTKRIVEAFSFVKEQLIPLGAQAINNEQLANVQLVLVGKPGVGYAEVAQAIAQSPYAQDIIQLGFVSTEDLPALISGAKVFVFPSLYEGFGIPVLEAMAVGTPVVVARASSLSEVGGEAVHYADPFDAQVIARAIESLLDPQIHGLYRTKGLERVAQFSWQKTAQQTWNEIAKLS